jgi:hypothetical protein
MPSDLGQMTEGCENTENLRLQRKEGRRDVVFTCNLHIKSSVTLIFAVNLSFEYSHVINIILNVLN